MNTNTTKAQEMAIESITNSIKFSIDWYAKEATGKFADDEFMKTHCLESVNAYTQLLDYINHFKFI